MSAEKEKKRYKHSKPKKTGKFLANLAANFKNLSTPKKVFAIIGAVLLCVVFVLFIMGVIFGIDIIQIITMWKRENYTEITDPDIIEVQPINEKIVNIALFGIDTRGGEATFSGNSDSIMILSVNTETGDIKLMSVMRDSYLPIVKAKNSSGGLDTYNYKVNAAYANGGAESAIKTLNHNFGLDIKHYATVNFQGMAKIIDAVGGIEVEVRQAEINAKNGLNHNIREQAKLMGVDAEKYLVTKPGKQKLKGIQAVAWARIRSVATAEGQANDYGRTDRQRFVMEQLLNEALNLSPTEYTKLIKAILPHMRTSVSPEYALSLATAVLTKNVNFEQTRVPHNKYIITDNARTKAGSSVYFDPADAKAVIQAFIYDDISPDEFLKNYTPIKSNWAGITLGGSSSSSSNDDSDVSQPQTPDDDDTDVSSPDDTTPEETPSQDTSSTPDSSEDTPSTPETSEPSDSSEDITL